VSQVENRKREAPALPEPLSLLNDFLYCRRRAALKAEEKGVEPL
jgi:hypothetical protein